MDVVLRLLSLSCILIGFCEGVCNNLSARLALVLVPACGGGGNSGDDVVTISTLLINKMDFFQLSL